MTACRNGVALTIRYLLQTKQTYTPDTKIDNYIPLAHAIESGSLQAVTTLVSVGADVNVLFGRSQTSPLAWAVHCGKIDIARFLFQRGAATDHITSLGRTPLFYVWSQAELKPGSCEEMLRMLLADHAFSLSHEDVLDFAGFGAIHLAVICGTAGEVEQLLRGGVSPHMKQGPLQWDAFENAVYYGKLEVFELLLLRFMIDAPDCQG
jgi:hypothetical protein